MAQKAPESEASLAAAVVAELQRSGWEVYQEVAPHGGGSKRADIVARRGAVIAVVECKCSLSLALLNQLCWWRHEANLLIAAYAGGASSRASGRHRLAVDICLAHLGAGLWSVVGDDIYVQRAPQLRRHRGQALRRGLRPEQRSGEYARAGSAGGGYYTPFRKTCRDLERIVRAEPGITLRAALGRVDHHYSNERSALSNLPDMIRKGIVDGVQADWRRPLRLYPAGMPIPEEEQEHGTVQAGQPRQRSFQLGTTDHPHGGRAARADRHRSGD